MRRLARDPLFGEHLNGVAFSAAGRQYTRGGSVGNGAIGVVRRATENDSGETVAVKFLAPEPRFIDQSHIEDIYRRFRREGERGALLENENLVKVLTYEENEGGHNFAADTAAQPSNPFIIMQFIHGRTLEAYIRKEKLGLPRRELNISRETLHIACEVTSSLVYLHRNSIIHRDVKPANIFLSKAQIGTLPKTVKLGDFGVVKWGDFKASITTGTLTTAGHTGLGTLKYMAPEQSLDPQNVDFKCDMYSLGITLFELFTNHILHDIHHVIQIRDVRTDKGNVLSRLHTLKIPFPVELHQYEYMIDQILDCFLKRTGRPTSSKMLSILQAQLRKFESSK